MCFKNILQKIDTRSVHVCSLCEVSKDTPNYTSLYISVVTMLNRRDRNLAGYAQFKAICTALFDVCKRLFGNRCMLV